MVVGVNLLHVVEMGSQPRAAPAIGIKLNITHVCCTPATQIVADYIVLGGSGLALPSARKFADNAVAERQSGQFNIVGHTKFVEYPVPIGRDCLRAEAQLGGDILNPPPLSNHLQHLQLPGGKLLQRTTVATG